jgi:hypothetical protein
MGLAQPKSIDGQKISGDFNRQTQALGSARREALAAATAIYL